MQRRHQKVIEESPSPALTPGAARTDDRGGRRGRSAAGYRNAGTVEFLVEGHGDAAAFYFLEMNTRLQVEHAGHRSGRRRRSRARAAAGRLRRAAAVAGRIARPARPRHRSARLRRGSGARASCPRPAGCCSIASRAVRACASTPASSKAARCRCTTIRCWRRSSRPAKRARSASRGSSPRCATIPILGSPHEHSVPDRGARASAISRRRCRHRLPRPRTARAR